MVARVRATVKHPNKSICIKSKYCFSRLGYLQSTMLVGHILWHRSPRSAFRSIVRGFCCLCIKIFGFIWDAVVEEALKHRLLKINKRNVEKEVVVPCFFNDSFQLVKNDNLPETSLVFPAGCCQQVFLFYSFTDQKKPRSALRSLTIVVWSSENVYKKRCRNTVQFLRGWM